MQWNLYVPPKSWIPNDANGIGYAKNAFVFCNLTVSGLNGIPSFTLIYKLECGTLSYGSKLNPLKNIVPFLRVIICDSEPSYDSINIYEY